MLSGLVALQLVQMNQSGTPYQGQISLPTVLGSDRCFLNLLRNGSDTISKGRLLEAFQAGEGSTFIEHMKAGLSQLAKDERAILVLSG
jgi:hypothetical protein